jgi:hypothetical protein
MRFFLLHWTARFNIEDLDIDSCNEDYLNRDSLVSPKVTALL